MDCKQEKFNYQFTSHPSQCAVQQPNAEK